MKNAAYWIERLGLSPHPDGGYYLETYRSDEEIGQAELPAGFTGPRRVSTAIYYLQPGGTVNYLHRIKSDELWHFYAGSPMTLHVLRPHGRYRKVLLGPDVEAGQTFQAAVQAGSWFGGTVEDQASFTLVGCTVAPGFDFEDFELAVRSEMLVQFPQHAEIIRRLTKA